MSESPEADHARIVVLRQQLADLEAEMRRFAEEHTGWAVYEQVLAWAARLKALQG